MRFRTLAKSRVSQVLCGLVLWAGASSLLLILDHERTAVARAEQLAYLPKGDYLKLAVLGYRQVVADLIWLQAVQHIGAKRDTQLGYTWTYHAVDVLTDLDPTARSMPSLVQPMASVPPSLSRRSSPPEVPPSLARVTLL